MCLFDMFILLLWVDDTRCAFYAKHDKSYSSGIFNDFDFKKLSETNEMGMKILSFFIEETCLTANRTKYKEQLLMLSIQSKPFSA